MANFVLILCDDLDENLTMRFPGLLKTLGPGANGEVGAGAAFSNAFVTTPLCGPSRASILTGQYVHNHGIKSNLYPDGGAYLYREKRFGKLDLAAALCGAGYRTIYVGKYLNEYEGDYTPAGFERWYGYCGNYGGTLHEFRENGVRTSYSRAFHHDTYLMRDIAVAEVTAPSTRPFFLVLSFNAPHKPSYCAPEDEGKFGDVVAPRTPSREEEDVSDKPAWVRGRHPHNTAETAESDEAYRKKMRAMPSVTRAVNALERALDNVGKLEDTYFIFTSDNGYRYGEHGIDEGKRTAYEEDLATPMFVRGPGIMPGSVFDEVALNIDIAPTILELANAAPLLTPDGRSLAPILRGEQPSSWRDSFLIEYYQDDNQPWILTYQGVRTQDSVYVEYEGGESEFYDLTTDPYELENRPADAPQALKDRLAVLRSCSGAGCREGD